MGQTFVAVHIDRLEACRRGADESGRVCSGDGGGGGSSGGRPSLGLERTYDAAHGGGKKYGQEHAGRRM